MELRARHIVEGLLSGMHRSPYFGQSVEFLQHREYVRGDDHRRIDWKVWAKQERYYVKQFEEETNLRCMLLVDVSKSMAYGRGPLNKFQYGATAAACLAYLALRQQDGVGCVAYDAKIKATVPIRSKRNHLLSVLNCFAQQSLEEKTGVQAVLTQAAELFPRRGMMILISDLLGDTDGLFKGLRLLRQQGHDVLVLHVLDDDELDFPFSGPTRFEGMESPDFLNCNPRALRDGYLKALGVYLDTVRRECAKAVVDYQLIRTSDPLDVALTKYLSRRLGMHGRN